MSRRAQIVFAVVGWVLIVAIIVATTILRQAYEQELVVDKFVVKVTDADRIGFVTPEGIVDYLAASGLDPVGQRPTRQMTSGINSAVERYNFVERSKTYFDYGGTVTVELTQRQPIMRVIADSGKEFYLTDDRYLLPVGGSAPRLLVVTGSIDQPFGNSFCGNLDQYAAENEKKSDKNYLFICKLIKFVDWLQTDRYWRNRIAQIVILPKANDGQESEVLIVPNDGDYTILLGTIDGYRDKLSRFRAYAEAGLTADGQQVVVKYRGQVVRRTMNSKTKTKN